MQLNCLNCGFSYQESVDALKEPLGIVYSEDSETSALNLSDADSSTGTQATAYKNRQLTEGLTYEAALFCDLP